MSGKTVSVFIFFQGCPIHLLRSEAEAKEILHQFVTVRKDPSLSAVIEYGGFCAIDLKHANAVYYDDQQDTPLDLMKRMCVSAEQVGKDSRAGEEWKRGRPEDSEL